MPDKTLFIGHSLVGTTLPYMLDSFMEQRGIDRTFDAQLINGAPLRWNWDNGTAAQGVNARAVLPSGDYDTVIITESTLLQDQIRWNDSFGYAARFYDLALSGNPDTRFYVYETWPSLNLGLSAWHDLVAEDLSNWESIADHVNSTRPNGAAEVLVIPAAQALLNLSAAIDAGQVPGFTSITDLFADHVHLTDLGNWFIAALHAEVVNGIDADTLPTQTYNEWDEAFNPPTPAVAAAFREIIDQTLDGYTPDDPGSGTPPTGGPVAAPIEITGDDGNDVLTGTEATNLIQSFGGNDILNGGLGNDTLDGGEGWDRAVFSGDQANYTLTMQADALEIEDRRTDGDGTDSLTEIEALVFGDSAPFDISSLSEAVRLTGEELESLVELYIAYFNRAPDAIGLNFWGTAFANGHSLATIATLFSDQPETHALYPEYITTADMINAVYANVLGRGPDAEGTAFWQNALDGGGVSRGQFIMSILEGAKADAPAGSSPEFIAQQAADRQYLAEKTDIGAYFAVHMGLSNTSDAASVMAAFNGSAASFDDAIATVNQQHSRIVEGGVDAFLMPLVGVLETPDFI